MANTQNDTHSYFEESQNWIVFQFEIQIVAATHSSFILISLQSPSNAARKVFVTGNTQLAYTKNVCVVWHLKT